jgi:CRISPR-associated protein Cas1
MERQAVASQPLRKRLWSQIVAAKIEAQAAAIEMSGKNPVPLRSLLKAMRSGDSGNVEALAAQRYFVDLFGKTFHRNREEPGMNSFLNYGYTVLRAATRS